jgi:diacylglycerol kinase family enzyme
LKKKKLEIEATVLNGTKFAMSVHSNGKYFGSGLRITHTAKVNDGKFSITWPAK